MFIFARPFRAVGAGLSVALLTVWVDRACEAPVEQTAALFVAVAAKARLPLVSRRSHAVSSAPVRDLSLSCRLPPAS